MANKILSILAAIFILISPPGSAMSLRSPLKACIFSEMQLKLTLYGAPAVGAKITRSVNWKKEITDIFTADEKGFAKLPAMYSSSITQVLPVEFLSSQVIMVEYQGNDYKIWTYAKRDPGENSELGGQPFKLICEISDKPRTERAFNSILKTSCQW